MAHVHKPGQAGIAQVVEHPLRGFFSLNDPGIGKMPLQFGDGPGCQAALKVNSQGKRHPTEPVE